MNDQSHVATAVLVTAILAASGTPAAAQGVQTGMLQGTVRDATGLILSGVTVTATSPARQGPHATISDDNGLYVARGLPPGPYRVTFERAGFATVHSEADIDLGRATRLDATLPVAGVRVATTVTSHVPSPLASRAGGLNITSADFDRLPATRTLSQIAELAPGLTGNRTTPEPNQIQVAGAYGYDHVFLVDGVDVNDNLFGTPNPLFIEDALAEVQVLTSGISAEYGRFSGGVVNAITKSGGNRLAGTLRLQFTNDRWTSRTPFEVARDRQRPSNLNTVYEGTVGGPLVADRLWFLAAGRMAEVSQAHVLPQTGVPSSRVMRNPRGEIKLTATAGSAHTVQGSLLTNPTEQQEPSFPFSIDPATTVSRRVPNARFVAGWRGILSARLFATAQYSHKRLGIRDNGGTSTDITESPFLTLTQQFAHYNAPYFDATDPEDRNNRQLTGSVSYFLTPPRAGSHDLKGGAEHYRSRLVGGNSQSSTGFVFVTDYVEDASGRPALDADGRLVPRFLPFGSGIEQWIAVRGARMDIGTTSLYVQDRWTVHPRWTVNAGLRYERVRSDATGGITTVDTASWMPRLGTSVDATGDGRLVVQGTYGHYSGRYTEGQFGRNTPVGNPTLLVGVYDGPPGEGRDFAPGFDPANYLIVAGEFPTANVFVDEDLSSPRTREWTAAAGWQFTRGYAKTTYVWRRTDHFVEDVITRDTGTTTVSQAGITQEFQNILLRNSDQPERRYQGLITQSRYRLAPWIALNGHWTLQLRNHGNVEGEMPGEPALSSIIGDYPEIHRPDRHFPAGRTAAFQRHKVRLWTVMDADLGRLGSPSVTMLYRYDSGTTYSLAAAGVPLAPQQDLLLAGYASRPASQTLFFEGRGTGQFDDSHLVDAAINYQVPVWRTLGPWVRFEITNVFNSQPLIRHNVTVHPDPDSPVDALGLPTGYVPDVRFGQAESNAHYPVPRTFRVGVGVRF